MHTACCKPSALSCCSWVIKIAIGGAARANHAVLMGKRNDGTLFVYEPLPLSNPRAHQYMATANHIEAYKRAMKGWVPTT